MKFSNGAAFAIGILLLLANPFVSLSQKQSLKIETGVSETLAVHRQKFLNSVSYELFFSIPAERNHAIAAKETIRFNWIKNSLPLQLDFKEEKDHLKLLSVNGTNVSIVFENEHIVIQPKYLEPGANDISIEFTAGELSLNRNNEYLYTLLVPDRARTIFPCFDQPGLKARFQLSLELPLGWAALNNAPLQDSVMKRDTKVYHYKESDLFSTYLFSFAAGKFEKRSKEIKGRTFDFYYRETDSTKIRLSMDTIFGAHAAAIDYLEDYTGIKFPFQKLDFIALPDFQYGGMEHVGAIDYKASVLFLDSGATKDQENARSNLIAHETAHMWFGNLVTMQWFNDVWMKEVFANFMADKITQGTKNNNEYELKFLLSHFPAAYAVDRTAGANPIRQPLENLQEAGTLYGAIIYNKAPVMMRQLERMMGPKAFQEGIRKYLKQYSFGNATWPDLIRILDERTPADLQAWNKVWVNTPGRPQVHYSLQHANGIITKLTMSQKGEQSEAYLLPQFFELALVYDGGVEELTVDMYGKKVEVKEATGKKVPSYILFNSSGQGYGLFPIDSFFHHPQSRGTIIKLESPVMRASAYINWYENMLRGNYIRPQELMQRYLKLLEAEKEELNLNLIAGQVADIFWRLIPSSLRARLAPVMEEDLWQLLDRENEPNKKKILFRTFQSIALSKKGLDRLYQIWKNQEAPPEVKLTEDDYTALALNLAVKAYADSSLLNEQLKRISNPDRKERLQFLMPAVSPDVNIRNAFFASLKEEKIRKKESWVTSALGYLHHPLHASTSIHYLKESLEMLQEIQQTGDIFFPGAWLSASLGNYQTSEAAGIVRNFLEAHPHYNPKLKAKILQAADPLFRAEKLVAGFK